MAYWFCSVFNVVCVVNVLIILITKIGNLHFNPISKIKFIEDEIHTKNDEINKLFKQNNRIVNIRDFNENGESLN